MRYLAAWLDGHGCVPIHWLMEDAATAEIARAQLWQWLHSRSGRCTWTTARRVDFALLERALIGLPSKLADRMQLPGAQRIERGDRAARRRSPTATPSKTSSPCRPTTRDRLTVATRPRTPRYTSSTPTTRTPP